jgi:hypothetical protein
MNDDDYDDRSVIAEEVNDRDLTEQKDERPGGNRQE